MGWKNQSQRHSLASRGIKSKELYMSLSRQMSTRQMLGKEYKWNPLKKIDAYKALEGSGFEVHCAEDIWKSQIIEPDGAMVITTKVPYSDRDSPGVRFSYMTLRVLNGKVYDTNEDYHTYHANNSFIGTKWSIEKELLRLRDYKKDGD